MPHIPKAVCVTCGVELRIKKNDFMLQATARHGPYYKCSYDLYQCPICGVEIATGAASSVVVEHYQQEEWGRWPADAEFVFWGDL